MLNLNLPLESCLVAPLMFKKTTKGDTEGARSESYDTRVAGPGAAQAKKKLRNRAVTTDRNGEVTSKWRALIQWNLCSVGPRGAQNQEMPVT